jgi:hypothetical protein
VKMRPANRMTELPVRELSQHCNNLLDRSLLNR